MIKIDFKIEKVGKDKAVIHRRVLTPFFYFKLKTLEAGFIRIESSYLHMLPFVVPLPENFIMRRGYWDAKERYKSSLELITKEYYKVSRIIND